MAKEVIKNEDVEVVEYSKKEVEALERTTKRIKENLLQGKKAIYNIALQLAKVEKNELYKAGGYKSVTEYAQKELELGKATVSNYIRVANRFLETNNNGTFAGISLNDTAKEIDSKSEYPLTTLTELLVLDDEKVKQITDDGEIDSSMNQKQVRKVVAQYKPKKGKKQKEETATEDTEDTEVEMNEPVEEKFDTELFEALKGIDDIAIENEDAELSRLLAIVMNKIGYHF